MSVLVLILVAIAEAVVWLWRLRAGVGASRWQAGASTTLVCLTRMVWLWAGLKATLEGSPVVGAVAYCGAAGVATALVHGWGKAPGEEKSGGVGEGVSGRKSPHFCTPSPSFPVAPSSSPEAKS